MKRDRSGKDVQINKRRNILTVTTSIIQKMFRKKEKNAQKEKKGKKYKT